MTCQGSTRRRFWAMMALLAFLMTPALLSAQNRSRHADTWMFGNKCRMDWSADGQSFTTSTNTVINTAEGCTSFSDPDTGALRLYSDGIRVWDASNNVILTGLGGNNSAMHSGTVIPAPGIPNHVYVFGNPVGLSSTVNYHLFDLTSGVAIPRGITQTITFPADQGAEGLTTYQHPNGIDQWLFKKARTGVFVISVTGTGVSTPIFYPANTTTTNDVFGVFAVSHDGARFVTSGLDGTIASWDFDKQTGVLSNLTFLAQNFTVNSQLYGGAFSPDSSKLYFARLNASTSGVGTTSSVVQYDYNTDTFTTVSEASPRYTYAAIALGPDHKLYVASGGRTGQTLDVINSPDLAGAASDYVKDAETMAAGCDVILGLTQTPSVLTRIATVGRFDNSLDGPLMCGANTVTGVVNAPDNTPITVTVTDDATNLPVGTCTGIASGYAFTCATPVVLPSNGNYTVNATYNVGVSTFSFDKTFEVDCDAPDIAITEPTSGASLSDNTPTISGTTNDDTTDVSVSVLDDTMMVVCAGIVTPVLGTWSLDCATALTDGDYTVTATSTDAAGNSDTEGPVGFSIDATAPDIAISSPVVGDVSSDTTPTITGTSISDDPVVVTVTNSLGLTVCSGTVTPVAMLWSLDCPLPLADGDYEVTATSTDDAGNSDTEGPIGFSIDATAPDIAIVSPVDSSSSADTTPTITGTSISNDPVVVTVLDANGVTVCSGTVTPMLLTWSLDCAIALTDGDYTITATSTDAAGNSDTEGPVGFSIDATAPDIAITNPVANANTMDTTPTITGTSISNDPVVVTVTNSLGLAVCSGIVTPVAMMWSLDCPTALADGDYEVTATSTDAAGNSDTEGPVGFSIDATAPVIAISSPVVDEATSDTTPTITGTSASVDPVVVTVLDANGVTVCSGTVIPVLGMWSLDCATALPEGDYTVTATSTDAAGNTDSDGPVSFSVDATAPVVAITSPAQDTTVTTRDVNVVGTSEPNAMISVTLVNDNGDVVATKLTTTDAQGNWTVSFQGLDNAEYVATATATDEAQNSASDDVTFTVDSLQPTLTITSPLDGALLSDNTPDTDGSTSPDATVQLVILDDQGNVVQTLDITPDAAGTWSATVPDELADGTYTFTYTATATNGLTTTVEHEVTIDTTPPVVDIATPADNAITNFGTVTVTGTTETGATLLVVITDDQGMEVFRGEVTPDANGAWSADAGTLSEGTYTVTATATDAAGNASTDDHTLTIDTSAPMVTITAPTPGQSTPNTRPVITGTAAPGQEVVISIDGIVVGTATADDQGNWTLPLTNDLALGDHTVSVTATDEAGNEGSSGVVNFTITEPVATTPVMITSPTDGSSVDGPSVTVTGTGMPGAEVVITIGDKTNTVTVGADGTWTTTLDGVEPGEVTITATSGDTTSSITVTVNAPIPTDEYADLILTGGCSVSPATGGSQPLSGALWMLLGVVFGGGFMRRRRR